MWKKQEQISGAISFDSNTNSVLDLNTCQDSIFGQRQSQSSHLGFTPALWYVAVLTLSERLRERLLVVNVVTDSASDWWPVVDNSILRGARGGSLFDSHRISFFESVLLKSCIDDVNIEMKSLLSLQVIIQDTFIVAKDTWWAKWLQGKAVKIISIFSRSRKSL